MRVSGTLGVLFAFLVQSILVRGGSSEGRSTLEAYTGVLLTSVNNTRSSYASGSFKKSGPAPFRLAILAMLVSDFVIDNFAEIGNGFREFDVIKFYEEVLKHGGTRGVRNYKECCFSSCMECQIIHIEEHHHPMAVDIDSVSEKISQPAVCEALCDHTIHFLESMDYFFSPTSELFELKISDKDVDRMGNGFPERSSSGLVRGQGHMRHAKSYHRETEEKEDIAKVQSFSSDNKLSLESTRDPRDPGGDHEDSSGKDASIMNFIEDEDFENEEMVDIRSRLLLLWDVDKTLWDGYNFVQNGVIYGRSGKFNPFSMSLLFMIRERQQYDPRILDQYVVTYGRGTLRKLQSPFLKSLCYSCWDLMRVYDRYFAERQDSPVTQDFKRVIEAKEHNTISFNGEELKFRNCPGTLKNLLYWKGKDIELFRNYIVSADEDLRRDYFNPSNLTADLSRLEIEYNFRYPFKTRNVSKIDEIVTVLVDDTAHHLKLTCVEEYHMFNMVVIPIIPFKALNIDDRIEMELKSRGRSSSQTTDSTLTNELQDHDLSQIRGVDSMYVPFILNDALNQVPINANSTELSRAIRRNISELVPGRFPESQCNYDITNSKPIYLVFLSSCKFFNDVITLLNNLPESHPTFGDIQYLLTSIDAWGFDDASNTKMCSVVNDSINSFAELCEKTKSGKHLRDLGSEEQRMLSSKRVCSISWKHSFFFGFALKEHYGPIPLNALTSSMLPRRRSIILNIEADHLFNSIPLSMYENRFFYCTIKTNLFSSTFETIRKVSIASKSTLKYAQNSKGSSNGDLKSVLQVARGSAKVFQSNLKNLFENLDSGGSTNTKLHYKIYDEYTNCIFID